jgi:DNA/RNA endonuclease G (NUC1)
VGRGEAQARGSTSDGDARAFITEGVRGTVPHGLPSRDGLKFRDGYALAYDRRTRNPAWVCEHLTAARLTAGKDSGASRRSKSAQFREDPSAPGLTGGAHACFARGRVARILNTEHTQQIRGFRKSSRLPR